MSKINIEDMYPLSPVQQGMLFHTINASGTDVYVVQIICNFLGELDARALKEAWRETVSRHPVLRTAFAWERRDDPLQVVLKDVSLAWKEHDLRDLSTADQQEWLGEFKAKDRSAGFNLSKAPLMRFNLFRLGEQQHQFMWTHHHMLLDGWSIALLMGEVAAHYQGFALKEKRTLPRPRPFRNYIDWLRQQELSQAENFWKQHLSKITTPTALGFDKGVGKHTSSETEYSRFEAQISKEITAALRAFAQRHKLTLNTLIRAAWALLLSRYSGSEDVVFGATQAGRPHVLQGVDSMIGLFINTLPIPINVDPQKPLLKWLTEIQNFQTEMSRFEHSPLQQIQRWSRRPGATPLFESILVFENYPASKQKTAISRQLQVDQVHFVERSNYPLTIIVDPGECLSIMVGYDSQRFEREGIESMLGHMKRVLETLPHYASRPVSHIPMLSGEQLRCVLQEWNQTSRQYEGSATLQEMFEQEAERNRGRVAAVYGEQTISYQELNERANQLAHYLRQMGVGPETAVGVMLERSLELIVAILGILKAGGAYVPLDPTYPKERLALMMEGSNISLLLITEGLIDQAPGDQSKTVALDSQWEIISRQPRHNLECEVTGDNIAYVIYTSGSTGKPKGVMISHRGILNRLLWMQEQYVLTNSDRVMQKTPASFDVSVWEFFWPIINGATLVFASRGAHQDPATLIHEIIEQGVTVIHFVPSMLRAFLSEPGVERCATLKRVICSGEALPYDLQSTFFNTLDCKLDNLYGPTEASVDVTFWACDRETDLNTVPIGRPISNTKIYLLDANINPAPPGIAGELHIQGIGLARGYIGCPDITAEKFIPDPFSSQPGSRIYKTGDLARFLSSGNIEFLGRLDHQVKVRGLRIELGEIEVLLSQCPGIQAAVVQAEQKGETGVRLIAYVLPQNGQHLAANDLRDYLKQKLPEYVVPASFVFLERMLLTSNGKIDRNALSKLEARQPERDKELEAPRNEIEQILVDTWREVLGVPSVRLDDNFFELGGDSILNILVIARLKKHGLKITPKQLYDNPTVASLAEVVTASEVRSEPEHVSGELPLTPIQRWFFQQNFPAPHHYNQSLLFKVHRPINALHLERAVEAAVLHHDVLRLRFTRDGAQWRQSYGEPEVKDVFTQVDISHEHPEELQGKIESICAELQGSLNLSSGPIVRAVLFNIGLDHYPRLLIIIHHLAVDGVSWRILLEDIQTCYDQIERGEPVKLPAKTISYKRWAERLEHFSGSTSFHQEQAYWLAERVQSASHIPVDFSAPIEENIESSASTFSFSLGSGETDALLRVIPAKSRIQIIPVLLTALAQTFGRLTGERTLPVELEGHGREPIFDDVDVSRTVGWFTTLFPVYLTLPASGDPGLALKLIDENLRSMPKRGLGYGLMRYMSRDESLKQKLQAVPQPEVIFNYLGQFEQSGNELLGFRVARESYGPTVSPDAPRKALLEIECYTSEGKLQIDFRYSRRFHRQSTVERMADEFIKALSSLIEYCVSDKPDQQGLGESAREKIDIEDIYPVSPMQQGLIFHTISSDEPGVYFNQFRCTLEGDLDTALFKRVWEQAVERHAILRTSFVWKGMDEPMQAVARQVSLPWREYDWRAAPPRHQDELLNDFLRKDRDEGFELTKAPLMRLTVFRRSERTSEFIWSFHHLLLDGWSLASILKEVISAYEAARLGQSVNLEAPRPYRDFIEWLRDQDQAEAESYWRGAMKGFTEPTPLPIDGAFINEFGEPGESAADKEFAKKVIYLSPEAFSSLQSFGRKNHITMYTILQGAWAILLGRYADEDEVVFGAVVSGRPAALDGVDDMAGLFINTMPVRVRANSNELTAEWLYRLQSRFVEARQYEYARLVDIQRWSDLAPGTSLFDTILVYENYPVDQSLRESNWSLKIVDIQSLEKPNYPISIIACLTDSLSITALYDPSRISEGAAESMLGHMKRVLETLPQYAARPVSHIPMLSGEQLRCILQEWNQTSRDYERSATLQEMFEQEAERSHDRVAAVYGEQTISYQELNERANQVAHYLRQMGVGSETTVGICLRHSLRTIIGLLGIMKAGGAYVPLDPTLPPARLAFMQEDAGMSVLLMEESTERLFVDTGIKTVSFDRDWDAIARQSTENPANRVEPSNLAYVIYTSGSTGLPKGVMISHGSLSNYLNWSVSAYRLSEGQGSVVHTSLGFDLSVTSLFTPLLAGRECHILPDEPGVEQLARALSKDITFSLIKLTPAHLELLKTRLDGETITAGVNVTVVGGEALLPETAAVWQRIAPGTEIINEYGPTETVVGCCVYKADEIDVQASAVPIGQPIANTRLYILDKHMRPVPVGIPGELHIAGAGLARGYLNRPEQTAEKFIPDPFSEHGARLYKSGDLARYRPDGNIEFLGRIDNQVKIRGYRIELGEIEAVLSQHESINQAVVIARDDELRGNSLAAYLVNNGRGEVSATQLRDYVRERLPDYMVPEDLIFLEAIPLTHNGKLDRKALPAPGENRFDTRDEYKEPSGLIEKLLAQIWSQVLHVDDISVDRRFVDLGGNSLLAIQVVAKANEAGLPLSFAHIFQHQTIAQLANVVSEAAPQSSAAGLNFYASDDIPSPVVPIQPNGSAPPFFCVHPGVGIVNGYEQLAARLGSDQPFYGIQDPNIYGTGEPDMPIEDMAGTYIRELQTVQPEGPYLIGGWSFGGLVAYEMAVQLSARGHDIAALALLDTPSPKWSSEHSAMDDDARLLAILANVANPGNLDEMVERISALPPEEQLNFTADYINSRGKYAQYGGQFIQRVLRIFKARVRAVNNYSPSIYRGHITLFRASEGISDIADEVDQTLGWGELSPGPVEVHFVPGTHDMIVFEPHVEVLATRLAECITRSLLVPGK